MQKLIKFITMSNITKKQWGHNLTLKQAIDITIEWCIRARDKNILTKRNPTIFYSCIIEDTPPIQFMHNISTLFKYSQKDVPYIDQARDSILRCLSIAFKTHFFLFENSHIEYEPYFFTYPKLNQPNQTCFGLVYKIANTNKSIVVSETALIDMFFMKNSSFIEFNAVVNDDSFKWYSIKNWSKIKAEYPSHLNLDISQLYVKAHHFNDINELHAIAHTIQIPYEMKDYFKAFNLEWSKKHKVWFAIKGFDMDSVYEYFDFLRNKK